MVWGCISAHAMGDLHICDGTIDAEAYVGILERHMLPSTQSLFPGTPCLFQQDNARPHSARVTTAWLRRHRVRVLDWSACSPDLSPIENVGRIMKRRSNHRLLSSSSLVYTKNGQKKTATIDIFSSQTISKCNYKKRLLPSGKHASVPFLSVLQASIFKSCLYLSNRIKFIRKNTENIFVC